jgi:alcohol dehydrogenase
VTPQFDQARALIRQFKGDAYLNGFGVLAEAGRMAAGLGATAVLVHDDFPGAADCIKTISDSLRAAGIEILESIPGARPNAPREDVARITARVSVLKPALLVSFGGGSTIDATKAAGVLHTLGGTIDDYFGMNMVAKALEATGKTLTPHLAIQTASSSAAHLTKYSNITDLSTGQKKLIVDTAIVPARAIFDYGVTLESPPALTADGALDGVSHSLEVLYSSVGKPAYGQMEEIANEGIRLVMTYLPRVIKDPHDREGREALGLATDLGGYAIMIGGTNGAHLTSFSLIDILSHGRACAMLNPYYTVFFAPAIQEPLKLVAKICQDAGCAGPDIASAQGRQLGTAVAEALIAFEKSIGFPSRLAEVPGFGDGHITRALAAAKDPQLKMKLENMPVPLTAEMVDTFMGPVLQAAKTGDLSLIRNA